MIVDTSVAVKWFIPEALSHEAGRVLASEEPLEVPDVMPVEFANAMWANVRASQIELADGLLAIDAIARGPELRRHPSAPLLARAFEIAYALDHPVYDCVYLALAEELDTVLVTADRRFFAAASRAYPRVRMLGEDQ